MKDTDIIQYIMDNRRLIESTQKPTKDEQVMIFKIADLVDSTQTHKPTGCGRCYESAKRAIMRNNPTLFI
tara:strand:- start:603 stop:812 length:210 start_codon:yes stop_codon:yes gene_type:complete